MHVEPCLYKAFLQLRLYELVFTFRQWASIRFVGIWLVDSMACNLFRCRGCLYSLWKWIGKNKYFCPKCNGKFEQLWLFKTSFHKRKLTFICLKKIIISYYKSNILPWKIAYTIIFFLLHLHCPLLELPISKFLLYILKWDDYLVLACSFVDVLF